ncbi:MAG: hypothetical protein COA90_00510 [Gammaproteobacteria bacterium]|nr:MAG: hypothetical protein COA90_00510 [Gammaproteobacteria bacterium]
MAVLIIATTSYRLFKLNQQQSTEVTRLQSQLSALCAAAVGTDNRIVKFEQALNQLKEHQNTFDLGQPEKQSYDHAIRLARKGAGIEQLIDNCNLTDEEAHLITRLHGSEDSGSQGLH